MADPKEIPREYVEGSELPPTASAGSILFFNTFREEIFKVFAEHGWVKMVKRSEKPAEKGGGHGNPSV